MRILLVEDDMMLGDGMVDALRSSGYTVDWLQQGFAPFVCFYGGIIIINIPQIG